MNDVAEAPKSRWPKILLVIALLALIVVIGAVAFVNLYFNEAYFKTQITQAIKQQLGRDSTIKSVNVSIFGGKASIEDLRIQNASERFKEKETFRAAKISASFSPFGLAMSGGTDIRGIQIEIDTPELIVEKVGFWPMEKSNLDDILDRLTQGPPGSWPKQTGLKGLSYTLTVKNGRVVYRDSEIRIGESRIENLEVSAKQDGLGLPVELKTKLAFATKSNPKPGTAELTSKLEWIDAAGQIDPKGFKNIVVDAQLADFDIPQITRHLHMERRVLGDRYVATLGKPVNGALKVDAPTLGSITLSGTVDTDGIISLWDGDKRVAGEIAGLTTLELKTGFVNGSMENGPATFTTVLASTRPTLRDSSPKLLEIKATSSLGSDGADEFHVNLKCAEALYETDIAAALDLKGKTSQPLTGEITARNAPGGVIEIKGDVKTVGGYVLISGIKQATQMALTFNMRRTPSDGGQPEKAQLAFTAASDAFKISTLRPALITDPSNPEKIAAEAQTQIFVDGRMLWKQFGPMLNVFGLGQVLEEQLDGQLTLSGSAGKLTAALNGTLQRQGAMPAPIKLNGKASFNGEALKAAAGQAYMSFELGLASAADKSLNIQMAGTGTRTGPQETFDLPVFTTESELAALNVLNQRFGAYASILLGPKYDVGGTIKQSGKSKLVRTLDAEGKILSSELTLSTEVQVVNLLLRGPALVDGGPPLSWADPQLALNLQVIQQTQGETSQLQISGLTLTGQGISITGDMAAVNLNKLTAASKAENNVLTGWVNTLPSLKLDARVANETFARMKALGVFGQFSNEPLLAGDLVIKASFDSATKKLDLPQAIVNGPHAKTKLLLKDANAAALAGVLDVSPLSFSKLLAVLPSAALDAQFAPEALERLQARKLLPAGTPLQGELILNASVTPESKSAAVQTFSFKSGAAQLGISAPSVPLQPLGEFLDLAPEKRDLDAILKTLPSSKIAFNLGAGAFGMLNELKLLPSDPPISGETLGGILEYDATQDVLTLTKLTFIRGNAPNVFLANAMIDGRVSGVKQIPAKLNGPAENLLPHLADTSISLSADIPVLCAYLKRIKSGEAFADDVAAGVIRFGGPVSVRDVKLKTAGGVYDVSATIDGAVSYYPRPAGGQPPATMPLASLAGVWSTGETPLKLSIGGPQKKISGAIVLDNADVRATVAGATPGSSLFTYAKPAAQACKLVLDVTLNENGAIAVTTLDLNGGPVSFGVKNLSAHTTPKTMAKLERLELREGPLAGVLSGVEFDEAGDKLQATLEVETLDFAKLTPFLPLPAPLKLSGVTNKVSVGYSGTASGFSKGFTAADKLRLSLGRVNAEVIGTQGSDVVRVILAGDLSTSPEAVSSKALAVSIAHTVGGSAVSTHQFQTSLGAGSKTAGEPLLTALSKPGMPLSITMPVVSQGPLNVDLLQAAVDVLSRAASSGPAQPKAAQPAGFDGIKNLTIQTSLTAPAVTAGNLQLANVKVEKATLENLNFTSVNVSAIAFTDGAIAAPVLTYNLVSKQFATQFSATNLNLNLLTGKPATKDDYEIFGRLSANGALAGVGFEQADMATWNGTVTATLNDLILIKNDGKASGLSVTKVGSKLGGFGLGLLGDIVPVGGGIAKATGRALDISGDDFGLFLNKMEFEPFTVKADIENGRADIERNILKGKNKSAGLIMVYSGALSLPKQVFDPQFNLRLAGLPVGTEKSLRIDQLDTKDQEAIRKEFSDLKFPPIILRGSLKSPQPDEKLALVNAFVQLDDRIDRLLREKKAREAAAANPGTGTTPASGTGTANAGATKEPETPPKRENPLDGLIDLFGRKKKKE